MSVKNSRAQRVLESLLVVTCLIISVVLVLSTVILTTSADEAPQSTSESAENQSANDEPEDEISEEFQATIDMIRDFWKREDRKSVEKLVIQPFKVAPRKDQIDYFPCQECHEDQETNPKERELSQEHEDIVLDHGGERFWCLTCHLENNRDYLASLKSGKIDYDDSHLLCGQCHFPRQIDWYMGAHGKRVGRWHGERLILLCVECHNPHSPSIKPKPADPPPKHIRDVEVLMPSQSAEKISKPHRYLKVWEKIMLRHKNEQSK